MHLSIYVSMCLQPLNQVIIWDKIITAKKDAKLKLTNEFVKYALIDQGMLVTTCLHFLCQSLLTMFLLLLLLLLTH